MRTRRYFERWVGDGKDDAVALRELVITEQLINGCGSELQVWLKDRRPQTVEELTTLADTYRLSRQSPGLVRSSQGRTSGGFSRHESDMSRQRYVKQEPAGDPVAIVIGRV